jgi:rhamnosyltransferase
MILVETNTVGQPEREPSLDLVGVIIPTRNAARHWGELSTSLNRQGLQKSQILVVDSSSTDATAHLARTAGYRVVEIAGSDFNHGGTRQAACSYFPHAEILIFLTQDAIPVSPDALATLCSAFRSATVGAAYGRQLARAQAKAIERHARHFNYPAQSEVRALERRETLGLKTAFLSNSFAAYRRTALDGVGGFPLNVVLAEDSVVAARMLLAGWQIAYVAEAAVVHSHAFSLRQEFARYFDTGVHHTREPWLLEAFGGAGDEGRRFVRSELLYLAKHERLSMLQAVLRTGIKWMAYRLGRQESRLPLRWKRRLTSNPNFWNTR